MPVRIYDIAKKLGLENKVVLVKAKELGISAAKVPSSSLDKITAEYLEQQLAALAPPPPPPPPEEPAPVVIVAAAATPIPSFPLTPEIPAGLPESPVVVAPMSTPLKVAAETELADLATAKS